MTQKPLTNDELAELRRSHGAGVPLPINQILPPIPTPQKCAAADILASAAETFRERNKVYGNNFAMIGPMMAVLFPEGVPAALLHSDRFHLFELILVKLSRFAVSGLTHHDSIHDLMVYAAMVEALTPKVDVPSLKASPAPQTPIGGQEAA